MQHHLAVWKVDKESTAVIWVTTFFLIGAKAVTAPNTWSLREQTRYSGAQDRDSVDWLCWDTSIVVHFTFFAVFCQNVKGVFTRESFFSCHLLNRHLYFLFLVLFNWSWGQALINISHHTTLGKRFSFHPHLKHCGIPSLWIELPFSSLIFTPVTSRFQVVCPAPSHFNNLTSALGFDLGLLLPGKYLLLIGL